MYYKKIIGVILLCSGIVLFYFFKWEFAYEKNEKQILLIQAKYNIPFLKEIKKRISLLVDEIINEELSIQFNTKFDGFFLSKNEDFLTLYKVSDCIDKNVNALIKNIDTKIKSFDINNVYLMGDIRFFGENKNKLVILIKDDSKKLALLHEYLKTSIDEFNKNYKDTIRINIYNKVKNEPFNYCPHVDIGYVNITSLKYYLESLDINKIDILLDSIMQKIKKESLILIKSLLNEHNRYLVLKEIRVL